MDGELLKMKILTQILKNQQHILFEIGSMHSSGKVNSGIYARDNISEELRKQTSQLCKEIKAFE